MSRFKLDEDAPLRDPEVWKSIQKIARDIVIEANETDAKIGIVYRRHDDHVLITSRGAPAVALEVGTATQPPKRYVKRVLDRRRID